MMDRSALRTILFIDDWPILINAVTGRFSRIRGELRTLANEPIYGYELEHSVPVCGDGHFLPLRWQVQGWPPPSEGEKSGNLGILGCDAAQNTQISGFHLDNRRRYVQ